MIKKDGKKWKVTDKSGSKTLGTHSSKIKALAQLRAIEASKAEKAKMEDGGIKTANDAESMSPILKKSYSDSEENEFANGGTKPKMKFFEALKERIKRHNRPKKVGDEVDQEELSKEERLKRMVERSNKASKKLAKK